MLKLAYPHVQENLVKHCLAAAPTAVLRNAIQEFSHDPHAVNPKSREYLESTPMVLAAIQATVRSLAGHESIILLTQNI